MAQDKKSIIVYSDWLNKFEILSDEEAGKLIKHFFRYVNDMNPVAPDRITQLSFIDIEHTLKRDLVKWEKRAERSRENGKSGGRPPLTENPEKPKETQQVILEPRKPDSVNVSVNVSDSVNVNKKSKKDIVVSQLSVEQTKEVFNTVKAFFNKIYAGHANSEYFFQAKDAAKIYAIIRKVIFKMKERSGHDDFTAEEISEATQVFMSATLQVADNWLQSNFNLSNIDSKFNDIYLQIKTNGRKSNNNIRSKSMFDQS